MAWRSRPRKSNNGKLELLSTGRSFGIAQVTTKRTFLVSRRRGREVVRRGSNAEEPPLEGREEADASGLVELPPHHPDKRQRPQLAAPVHAVPDDELVGADRADVVRPDVRLPS